MTNVEVMPTGNEWDAPVARYEFSDGTALLRRDSLIPKDKRIKFSVFYPHAVLFVDGVMSKFDQKRQPVEILNAWSQCPETETQIESRG